MFNPLYGPRDIPELMHMHNPDRPVCANCKSDYNPEDKYCRYCGAPMGEPDYLPKRGEFGGLLYGPPPVKRVHTCDKCGYSWETFKMADSAKFCPRCGGNAPGIASDDFFNF